MLPFGQSREGPQLLAHHHEVSPRNGRTERTTLRGEIESPHQATGAPISFGHAIGAGHRAETARRGRTAYRGDLSARLVCLDLENH